MDHLADDERQVPVDDDFDNDIREVPSHTPDFITELAEALSRLAPEVLADGKIDVEKLRELLDEDSADDGRERFGLMWPGKSRALKAAQAPTTATLVPDRENSKDWDTTQNVFIEGDNLEVLKILQKHYHGKIKMVYIDPPYNTGKDFIYPDNYKEGLQTYLHWTEQVSDDGKRLSTNPESAGRFHSNWLNMMYPRLKLARNLLQEDGVIAISIDDHEAKALRSLCDEIFGESCFLGCLPRTTATFGKNDAPFLASAHDYLLLYQKGGLERLNRDSEAGAELFSQTDAIGLYRLGAVLDASSLPYSENLDFPIEIDGKTYEPSTFEGKRTCWRWSKEKVKYGLSHGLIVVRNSRLYTKTYRDFEVVRAGDSYAIVPKQAGGTFKTNQFIGNEFGNRRGTRELASLGVPFKGPKPVALIHALLDMVVEGDSDAIVLDFFSGSATTAHAVMSANAADGGMRRHIQIQLPEPIEADSEAGKAGFKTIADIGRERIRRAGEKIRKELGEQLSTREVPFDVGFRSYRLSDTNFSTWRETSSAEQNALELRLAGLRGSADDNATPEILLTELLLKQGYSLTESVSEIEIAGLKVWSVADGAMLAVMDEHVKPSLEQLRAVVEAGPVRLVILEDVLAGDDQLKTNLVQHAKTHGVELWSA